VRPAVDGSDVNASAACVATLSRADSEAVQRFARTQRMTLSTLVQAAWALVLGHLCLRDDVIFGAAYSGRPTDIPGIEAMVGPCVNNVPVRVRIEYEKTLGEWLAALHRMQSEISEHQYAPLPMIQSWSAVPARFRLFDSLIVFQNYDGGDASRALARHLENEDERPRGRDAILERARRQRGVQARRGDALRH
jgi:non-ribosomal peptide synthetase component F